MTDYSLKQTAAWQTLTRLAETIPDQRIEDLLASDPGRVDRYSMSVGGLHVDFSKHLVTDEVMAALLDLAASSPLLERRDAMYRGEHINVTEKRAVRHTALRNHGADSSPEVSGQFDRMCRLAEAVREGRYLGHDGQPITDVINIGIGGSDLGPRMVCNALSPFCDTSLRMHFISNVDGVPLLELLKELNASTTLFVVASKSFTTQETMVNAETAASWFHSQTGADAFVSGHVIGITAAPEKAYEKGLSEDSVLEFWDWVGGRYSLWSAIGFPICLMLGSRNLKQLHAGAEMVDRHFATAAPESNLPILLGLLAIWYNTFLGAETRAVIPYCERLADLPAFLQQLDMESNGKRVTLNGELVDYQTGPVIWGQTGTNGQHAFFQLLHQGTRLIPVDLIGLVSEPLSDSTHHRLLLANMLGQAAALMCGESSEDPHRDYPGNKPTTAILLPSLTPESLGALISLYEHSVFTQGAIWNINSFDQWGVELGKRLANQILTDDNDFDASTLSLIKQTLR